MSRKIKSVTANTRRSIASRYNKGLGLVAIAYDFDLPVTVIRRVLTEARITIRRRGRPVLA